MKTFKRRCTRIFAVFLSMILAGNIFSMAQPVRAEGEQPTGAAQAGRIFDLNKNDRTTYYYYIQQYETAQKPYQEVRVNLSDMAEEYTDTACVSAYTDLEGSKEGLAFGKVPEIGRAHV